MRALALFFGIVAAVVGFSESEILTNEGETEYGFHGVVVNPKSQKLVLKCNYTGERYWNEDAEPPTYQWYKNQSVITKSSKYNIQNEGPASTLTVTSCDVSDAGNYTCKFNNKQEATLAVYMYPTIDHVEGSKIQVQGDPLTLLCKARGAPTPTVTWYKEDAELETDERIQLLEVDGVANAKLVIKDLQYQDKGHYVCKAKAANVTRSVEIHVRVKDKYAALWPFLGICAEVAVLCTIIFIYERRRTKPEFEDDDDKKESSSRK